MEGCGQAGEQYGFAPAAHTDSAKAGFIIAADRICARHLDTILAWLEQPESGTLWQQRATRNEGIYRIISATIRRLRTLGPPPGPAADAFAGYLKTLEARAVLYRLTGIADLRRTRRTAARLQDHVDRIKQAGDREAHRYGLQICGTGPRDIAPQLNHGGSVAD